jgi:hypothetical protein
VSASDNLRKHALECMRLAADCMQLAGDVHSPALQRHFLQMAREWAARAEWDPGADTQIRNSTKRAYPTRARTSRQQGASAPARGCRSP